MNNAARTRLSNINLVDAYLTARETIVSLGYGFEIDWQEKIKFANVSEAVFLRESAWVILSAGMRESVVRLKFKPITAAFMNWESAATIAKLRRRCEARAIGIFAHVGKIRAICAAAERVAAEGFSTIKRLISSKGIDYLETFDFIGPVTRYHLAKNIGMDVVKPDRHLVRMAAAAAFANPADLCGAIADATGDRTSVIDLVLWRFATVQPDYLDWFRERDRSADRLTQCSSSPGSTFQTVK